MPTERPHAMLLGALLGDALGTPLAGIKQGHIQQLAGGRVDGFLDNPVLFQDKPERNCLPGLHGAGGQRLLASLLIAGDDGMGREPAARVCAALQELSGEEGTGALRRPGRPLRRALDVWRAEFPWDGADWVSRDGSSEGIGPCALGLVPVALGLEEPLDWCTRLVQPTHLRLMPLAGAAAVAIAARLLLERQPRKTAEFSALAAALLVELLAEEERLVARFGAVWEALGWERPRAMLSAALSPLPSLISESNDDLALSTIVRTAGECGPEGAVAQVQHGFVPAGLAWALYRAFTSESIPRALDDVLNRGGETAAVASIVTGLMAARFGVEGFPGELLEKLRGRHVLAELLANPDDDAKESWLSLERQWSAEEERMRAPLREKLARQQPKEAPVTRRSKPAAEQATTTEDLPFAPPPHLWMKPEEAEDPRQKQKLKEARARRRIDWKEDRRKQKRDGDGPGDVE